MKLRATLTIDTEAKDFQEAAKIQAELEELCQQLASKHTSVDFDIRERRAQKGSSKKQNPRQKDTSRKYSGKTRTGSDTYQSAPAN
jgi:hypothetical protein